MQVQLSSAPGEPCGPDKSAQGVGELGMVPSIHFTSWLGGSSANAPAWGWDGEYAEKEGVGGLPSSKAIAHLEIWACRSHHRYLNYFQYFRKPLENCTFIQIIMHMLTKM